MTPKQVFRQIATENGYFGNSRVPTRIDYASKPVIYDGKAVLINILFEEELLQMNDAKGIRRRIEYCDPNSIELFESLIQCRDTI